MRGVKWIDRLEGENENKRDKETARGKGKQERYWGRHSSLNKRKERQAVAKQGGKRYK